MINVTVKVDVSGVKARLNAAKKGLGDRAVISALNKSAAQAQTRMSRLIRDDYVISAQLVRERLKVRRARRRGEFDFEAALMGNANNQSRAMNLIHFVERKTTLAEGRRRAKAGTQGQLFFKIKKGKGKATLSRAFVGNKGRTVFERTGKERFPIKPVQTIAVPQMFNTRKNRAAVERFIADAFPSIFVREAAYYLSTVK